MKTPFVISVLLAGLAAAPAKRLDLDYAPFVEDFRAAEGRVRLVTLLSPT